MKQKITIEIVANVTRHDYYPDPNHVGCQRCIFYTVCTALSNLKGQFPWSFKVPTDYPCRQDVQRPNRKYFKFKG